MACVSGMAGSPLCKVKQIAMEVVERELGGWRAGNLTLRSSERWSPRDGGAGYARIGMMRPKGGGWAGEGGCRKEVQAVRVDCRGTCPG